ncbi:hypothetical protein SAMN06265348_115118 [Pedobacter westerhofensis]|uniref:Uncharacterized protein n=1 Tax=Pedobacter westerhofensis TaxID=425512 RepID=A0A521FPC3_9SPHI|nr:hypothetical protein SAMN06265348_115118 [Pedobacter westerhofensis]
MQMYKFRPIYPSLILNIILLSDLQHLHANVSLQ